MTSEEIIKGARIMRDVSPDYDGYTLTTAAGEIVADCTTLAEAIAYATRHHLAPLDEVDDDSPREVYTRHEWSGRVYLDIRMTYVYDWGDLVA